MEEVSKATEQQKDKKAANISSEAFALLKKEFGDFEISSKMKYLFILGRNIELSIAEVRAFFRKNNIDFKQLDLLIMGY